MFHTLKLVAPLRLRLHLVFMLKPVIHVTIILCRGSCSSEFKVRNNSLYKFINAMLKHYQYLCLRYISN